MTTLDESWARAEAALSEGSVLSLSKTKDGYFAAAAKTEPFWHPKVMERGDTPVAALIALAESLERPPTDTE